LGYFRRDRQRGLALCSTKVLWPTSQLSGLGDFLARSAPYTLCLVLLRFPNVRARAFGAGLACLTSALRAVHVAYWSVFLFMMLIFLGGLYSPAILGLSFLVLFSLASNLLVFGVAVYQSRFHWGASSVFRIRCNARGSVHTLQLPWPKFPAMTIGQLLSKRNPERRRRATR